MLVSLQAQEIYTTGNIPKVHLQDKTRYVCNPAGILSAPACDEIDRMLYALEQQTGIETVVAVVPSIGSEDCFDFSHRLLNAARHYRKLSRPESQPELPGAPSPVGRYGKPHQRGTYQLQQCGEEF